MSTDSDKRSKARRAHMEAEAGDLTGASAADHSESRAGGGVSGFLRGLVGEWIYLEGARVNYRGILQDFFVGFDGQPSGLILSPCYRVGDWGDTPTSEMKMEGPHLVTWGSVCEVGAQAKNWPTE